MTKIITKLPVAADALKNFRESALMKMIDDAANKLELDFPTLCESFTARFNANEWIKMSNKDVYYINDIVAIMPNLQNFQCKYVGEASAYTFQSEPLKFQGFQGDLMTDGESQKCFNDKLNYFRNSDGDIIFKNNPQYPRGITFKKGNQYWYRYVRKDSYKGTTKQHGNTTNSDSMISVPIFRFNGEDSAKATAAAAIFYWLKYDLTPSSFKSNDTKNIFNALKNLYTLYKDYMKVDGEKIIFDRKKIFNAIIAGTTFNFLPDAPKILSSTTVEATDDFVGKFKTELLKCDQIRADIDPYDENILIDPNRGHWDLWDYGEGEEKVGEITLAEGMTARDPADDINHGIVAIDFGTKSTVVVYEDDHLQILPIQVSGKYSEGVKAENYENPTVIQFIDVENFVAAYKARAGRPKTQWDDVTVSHTAFDNLTNSDSKHYYSFLTGLKHWCGSKDRLKLKDRHEVTKDLPPFLELKDDDLNPLEYYAYYLGLYINNMSQEKKIFLKYIMSFPVTYDKAITAKMRESFARGLKKSFPTALLSNEELMKNFVVQDGASEPAAYAITALQEFGFDPEGDEKNYYAVFDFGGGTTDFDFGVFSESELDRYDYFLMHFGENGDRTLGGENLLKLLAYEVFKANADNLLKPNDDNSAGKIQFTLDAEEKNFVGSDALIKNSQEANTNMHNLIEKLRPVWENPDGEEAKKIFEGGIIEVDLFTDRGTHLTNFPLYVKHAEKNFHIDLKKILRDRIEQGIRNFFIAMKEAFTEASESKEFQIASLSKVKEISIFLAGNSSKSALVEEIFNEYIGKDPRAKFTPLDEFPFENGVLKDGYVLKNGYEVIDGEIFQRTGDTRKLLGSVYKPHTYEKILETVERADKTPLQKKSAEKVVGKVKEIFGLEDSEMPKFKIYPALGTDAAKKIQSENEVEIKPKQLSPTGKTGVAFGLLSCRDSGNVKITHLTPDENKTPFQFYIGRNKKRKFKPIIDKNTKLDCWYEFIDAGNNFDILYSDLPEAATGKMDVQKSKQIHVTLDEHNAENKVFIRAVMSNVIEYQVAVKIEDLKDDASKQIELV